MNRTTRTKTVTQRALARLLTATVASALAACSGNPTSSGPDLGAASTSSNAPAHEHNRADVMFAQSMIPHHAQAVTMAEMVPSHTGDPKMIELARRIQNAQQPEIDQMTGWLTAWRQPVAPPSATAMPPMAGSPMPGMDHGQGMPGMMSHQDMTRLGQSRDANFDGMWLRMMIRHHEGAVEMSEIELAQGSDSEAKALAQKIIDAQRVEITEMKGMPGAS